MQVVDSDCHVMEPRGLWEHYLPQKFRERVSSPTQGVLDWSPFEVDGVPIYRNYPSELTEAFQRNVDRYYPEAKADGFSSRSLISAMDKLGIEKSYLYPSLALGVIAIDGQDKELASALSSAYNSWLFDYCALDSQRLRPVPLISLHCVEGAVGEVRRVHNTQGARAVVIRPNPINGRTIGDQYFRLFWQTCNDLGVSVALHEGCHTRLPAAGSDRFGTHFSMHACCHPMEQMMAFTSLVENGIFERFRDLQVAFLESGAGWVPYFLSRLDAEYRHWRFQVPEVKKRPSEYFATNCFVSVEDRLLWGSDYPHPDHAFGEELAEIRQAPLSKSSLEKILWSNPIRFYERR